MGGELYYPKCSFKVGALGLWNKTKFPYVFSIPATSFLQNLNSISVPRMHANNAEVVKRKVEKLFFLYLTLYFTRKHNQCYYVQV